MGKRKEFTGTVESCMMQKTCIVRVMHMQKHPKYSRIMKRFNKFKVHDEKNSAKTGDTVRIEETRPISKDKRFRLVEVIKRAATQIELKEDLQ